MMDFAGVSGPCTPIFFEAVVPIQAECYVVAVPYGNCLATCFTPRMGMCMGVTVYCIS